MTLEAEGTAEIDPSFPFSLLMSSNPVVFQLCFVFICFISPPSPPFSFLFVYNKLNRRALLWFTSLKPEQTNTV